MLILQMKKKINPLSFKILQRTIKIAQADGFDESHVDKEYTALFSFQKVADSAAIPLVVVTLGDHSIAVLWADSETVELLVALVFFLQLVLLERNSRRYRSTRATHRQAERKRRTCSVSNVSCSSASSASTRRFFDPSMRTAQK